MDDSAEVFGGLAIGGAPALGVVLREDLGPVALALGDHADVEARVEEFAGRELAEREDGAVEVEVIAAGAGLFTTLGAGDTVFSATAVPVHLGTFVLNTAALSRSCAGRDRDRPTGDPHHPQVGGDDYPRFNLLAEGFGRTSTNTAS